MFQTGFKLNNFKQDPSLEKLLRYFDDPSTQALDGELELVLKKIFHELKQISQQAQSPISHTKYGAIVVFDNQDEFSMHAGANIDPERPEFLKSPEHRNCAETQAVKSAKRCHDYNPASLKYIFLYRMLENKDSVHPQKLLPCKDCYQKYLLDLMSNKGKLVVFSDFDIDGSFFKSGYCFDEAFRSLPDQGLDEHSSFYFKIFDHEKIPYLNIEKQLGARVLESE